MARQRSSRPFCDELPLLLAERALSARALARIVGIDQSYLSAVLNGRRAPSERLLTSTADALSLDPAHFREYREARIIARLREDDAFLNRVYATVERKRSTS
jgi:transcriptional regulator with XRE-family HTH domain